MINSLGCILISILSFHSVHGENKNNFFKDTVTYTDQLEVLAGRGLNKEEALELNNFTNAWKKNAFSNNQKLFIVNFSNELYDRNARGYQFRLLTNLLYTLSTKAQKEKYLPAVLDYLNYYMEQKRSTLYEFENFLINLLELINQNYIHSTNTLQWVMHDSTYAFSFENHVFRVIFSEGNLTCYSKHDSITIAGTSGTYFPTEEKWVGQKGLVTWERAGFNQNEINAQLNHYEINLKRVEYSADSVLFSYPKYFSHPILGKLIDKVMYVRDPSRALYPEFVSYSQRYSFKNLYENIDYDGGFTLKGAKIIGSGTKTEDAQIIIKKGPKILMTVKSEYFVLRPNRINGINTTIKINLGKDSIYHTNLSFIYFVKRKEVDLLRTEEYSSLSPYYNSYHKLDMDFDELIWRIDQPRIELTMSRGASIGRASFQSQNFYNRQQYDKLQGMDAIHPLIALRNFSHQVHSRHFTSVAYDTYLGKPLSQVRQELMMLDQKGFIYYDSQTDQITLKKRLFDYLNANFATVDYDVIDFISTTQAPQDNASLDMNTYDLYINGIPKIAVSDSQNVAIYPTRQQIIMKQNRSFQFDGKVVAGLFTFYGSNFFFNYNTFTINLQNVDSVSLNVLTGKFDNYGFPITHRVQNVIQHLTGEIQVDRADNKSGRKHFPQYPRFVSRENSYVYYQNKNIAGGVYPEESFFFEVSPFVLNSLDHITKKDLAFNGSFQSAGILPTIKESLRLQPDYSLGFHYNTGQAGIPVYNGKGKLYAVVNLSNKGLRGDGKLHYITSVTTSKDFMFYPDSMNTSSQDFLVNPQFTNIQFPKVHATENYIHWAVRKDKMYINQGNIPFSMFNPQTNLQGKLCLEPRGLIGSGKMDLSSADINSIRFTYKAQTFDADTSQFLLKSLLKKGYTVLTENNVKSHIDFKKQKGEFTANGDYTKVDFPENKYISFLDYFKWNMEKKTLDMGSHKPMALSTGKNERAYVEHKFGFPGEPVGPRYVSVNRHQDSLNFVAPGAVYDYSKNLIKADNVKLIRVADAIIYPKDGKITVAEAAQMKTIYNCKIVAEYNDSLHTIHSADLNVQSRESFTGTGVYDYKDERGAIQPVTMSQIKVDSTHHMIATANLLETDSFKLSPYFNYQGKITLHSNEPLLSFDGAAQPVFQCKRLLPSWLKFDTVIDPRNIFIPVRTEPVNINNNKIYAGVFMGSDSIHVYPAFLSGRRNYNDSYIITSSGLLHYNHKQHAFEIATKKKMQYPDSTGNYLSVNRNNCTEYGEGSIDLGVSLDKVKLSNYGDISYNLNTKDAVLDMVMNIDFLFSPVSLKVMANQIDSFPDLTTTNPKNRIFTRSLHEILGPHTDSMYVSELEQKKVTLVPQEVQHTLNFTSIRLRWNPRTHSYQSEGKIGVGNILNTPVNKMVDGYVEITRKRSGDLLDIYLKLSDNNYYYFGYAHGSMQVFSPMDAFDEPVRNLSVKDRSIKGTAYEVGYIYLISSASKIRFFMRRYQQHLKGESAEKEEMEEQNPPEPAPELKPEARKKPVAEKDTMQQHRPGN